MYVENKHAPNAARFGGEIHLRYDSERFMVRYSYEFDRIQILEWDGASFSTMLPRDRSENDLLQVLRDADALAAPMGYTIWGRIDKTFGETLADRASDSSAMKQFAAIATES